MNMLIDFLQEHLTTIVVIVAVMSIVTFFAFGIDKLMAIKGSYRISEKTLLSLSFILGALGGVVGMYFFHHKTRKAKFYILVPLFAVLQIGALIVFNKGHRPVI